jgi:ribosomal 50S subunit-associated protein YjgA (DUF615 family)
MAILDAMESCRGTLIRSKSNTLAQNRGEYPITAAVKMRAIVRDPFRLAIFVRCTETSAGVLIFT